ncbi:MAG TPA: hypothetical protein VGL78_10970 [Solirubrobacteraceae bacterium]|jgi:hypothetical protein
MTAVLDPGESLATPEGSGRLGHPVGNGRTWGDPGNTIGLEGDNPVVTPMPADGTASLGTVDAGSQDGTGSR